MAGAGKKTFTAGETLTASDVNTYLMEQSVMVFGGTAARSSAIPTPSEGMTTYRTDTQQIESYDGAEWRGMSGMQLVKKQTVGTGVSSVTVTSAFSSTFVNYKILYTDGVKSADDQIRLRLGASTTGYFSNLIYGVYGTNAPQGATDNNSANWNWVGGGDSNGCWLSTELLGPQLSRYTRILGSAYGGTTSSGSLTGVHKVATSYTDFTLIAESGTLTGGTIYVYGYGT